jgi:hypothetical protein
VEVLEDQGAGGALPTDEGQEALEDVVAILAREGQGQAFAQLAGHLEEGRERPRGHHRIAGAAEDAGAARQARDEGVEEGRLAHPGLARGQHEPAATPPGRREARREVGQERAAFEERPVR